jgi:F0F1-type ATP synthase alpha subunit
MIQQKIISKISNKLFEKVINYNELQNNLNLVLEMTDKDVFQIPHPGHDVKVMMTQEYFFTLMARIEKAEGSTKTSKYNPDQLMSDFERKIGENK